MSQLLRSELKSLERKLTLLLADYNKLKDDYAIAKEENKALKEELNSKQQKLSHFHNKYKITKIANSLEQSGEESVDLKQMVNDYIEEIDKCIAQLSA